MSYIIDGLADPELDPARLLNELTARFGPAVVAMTSTEEADGSITSLLVDRKAGTWDGIQQELVTALRSQGFQYVDWSPSIIEGEQVIRLYVFR